MNPRHFPLLTTTGAFGLVAAISLTGQESPTPPPAAQPANAAQVTLIQHVRIFDGTTPALSPPTNVLVRGHLIETISTDPIPTDRRADTTLIDGGGRTLMPGLIDAHAHTMMESIPMMTGLTADVAYASLIAARAAEKQLLRGFTTVRDMGGASLPLKRAIDEGHYPGPRIYPSGATISQTGGHGDFRLPNEVPQNPAAPLTYLEQTGMTIIADGADAVLKRSREQLRNGATQLKLMAGGGVSSSYDPIDVTQYTPAEIAAAVSAARNWGTYVTVHAYTPAAIRAAVEAGVQCIEHGQLIDEPTARLLAEKQVWWSLQPFMDDPEAPSAFPDGSPNRLKQLQMYAGTDTAYQLAKKYHIRTAFGTDILFSPDNAATQGRQLTRLTKWFSPPEILKMATADNAELLALSGPRNPYPHPLGVVKPGAYADLLIVNGNPLEDITLLADPERNLDLIMKNGVVHKNQITR